MNKKLEKLKRELEKAKKVALDSRVAFEADGTITLEETKTLEKLEKTIQQLSEVVDALEDSDKKLDQLYEIIIETHQKVKTNPIPENKKYYKEVTQYFLEELEKAPTPLQNLWKKAKETVEISNKEISENLEKIEATKDRIDNLEKVESAKIYCIIKGTNPNGTKWGRIDFVGANYVDKGHNKVEYAGKDSNEIPLLVKYYSYENGGYKHLKDSNKLETAFDKQLMDTFLKAGKTSYEQYKNLGRDYEYTPKKAAVIGSGDWYINVGEIAQENHTEKVVEVPDWDNYGFEDLYSEYTDKCGKQDLTSSDAKALKEKMKQSINKQKLLLKELELFHATENDNDNNTSLLIEIWKKRIGEFEESVTSLTEDCITIVQITEPCEYFEPIFEEHEDLCHEKKLTKKIGDKLKAQMQDCIDKGIDRAKEITESIDKYKKIDNWDSDATISNEVKKLEKELKEQKEKTKTQTEKLKSLPERCIPPITSHVPKMPPINFTPDGFKRLGGYYKAADEVANWLISNPHYDIEITSDGQDYDSMNKNAKSWDEKIKDTIKDVTYRQRLQELLDAYKDDIIKAGKGSIDNDRIYTKFGKLLDKKVYTIEIPR